MDQEAKNWIVKKANEEIVGCCIDISNNCRHRYPIEWGKFDGEKVKKIIKSLDRISRLLIMFSDLLTVDSIIDDFFSNSDSHWKTESNIRTFKLLVKDALQRARDSKLQELGL
jgi:hypothetical protein